jgi:3'-phosphoadenosine 5'-phosphosulfate sulfotransferase (PAPS reductase)/FAD synthetase
MTNRNLDHHDDTVVIPNLQQPLALDELRDDGSYYSAPEVDLDAYDKLIVCCSQGKDSLACLFHLIDLGVDRSKIELWHHDVDGNEGSTLMDWVFMRDYARKFAKVMELPLYFSWLEGGFEGEMLKADSYSKPHKIETPNGMMVLPRDKRRSKPGTRLRFPQQSASLQTRWCSGAVKIDVGRRAINNQDRFNNSRVLFITGERREESPNRAKYNQLEAHACDRRAGRKARHVDHWRPVLEWDESQVWDILERYRVIPPVPYRLGWSRSSCMTCIYNSASIWATIAVYFPERACQIADYEMQFGTTISRKRLNVLEFAQQARPLEIDDLEALEQALSVEYKLPILLPKGEVWISPAGAYGKEGCGSV